MYCLVFLQALCVVSQSNTLLAEKNSPAPAGDCTVRTGHVKKLEELGEGKKDEWDKSEETKQLSTK